MGARPAQRGPALTEALTDARASAPVVVLRAPFSRKIGKFLWMALAGGVAAPSLAWAQFTAFAPPDSSAPAPQILKTVKAADAPISVESAIEKADKEAAQKDAAEKDKRMVVEARELIQDERAKTVTARGKVQIYYKGRTLEADTVVYDQTNKHVTAKGHVRMSEPDGRVSQSQELELTDDFKQGFVNAVQVETKDETYFSAARGERNGDITVFEKGAYTACKPCQDNETPPLWRLHAKRIIHDNSDKTIYYEDTSLQFLGVPIAYTPYFSSPDPSVKRRSGILSPTYVYTPQLGYGSALPIYWAVAPNMDLLVKPGVVTKQGFFGQIEWAHRMANGVYTLRLDGAWQSNPSVFANPPLGASNKRMRGDIVTSGSFSINDFWRYGWDITVLSDRYFLRDYRLNSTLLNDVYFRETASWLYLTGKGDRSWFDLRGYRFQGLSVRDYTAQQPWSGPVLDFNRAWAIDPKKSWGIGGQLEVDYNMMFTTAQAAMYESQSPRTFNLSSSGDNGIYNVCQLYAPSPDRNRSQCLLRGIGGDYGRATAQASWKRTFIDPIGQSWTPFAFLRGSGTMLNYNQSNIYGLYNYSNMPMFNADQRNFVGSDNLARGMLFPGMGVDYRYPFFTTLSYGSLSFEPIAQVVARPDGIGSRSLVNIDAQSLIFDDSNLFNWSKFSGYDRFETGTRLNYGGQATMNFTNGGFINIMGGQSYQVAGENMYKQGDAANAGLGSGLDKRRSDYVGRAAFAPNSILSFIAKGRFDTHSLKVRRIDLVAGATLGPATITAQYANYDWQPMIGFDKRRQGLAVTGRYDITKNYFVNGSVQFDLTRHLYNQNGSQYTVWGTAPVFSIATMGIGGGYHDECTTFTVNYSSYYQTNSSTGLPGRNQTFLATLSLRTLGEVKGSTNLGFATVNDGVKSQP